MIEAGELRPRIAAAQGLRARQDRGRDRLLSRRRARSREADRRRVAIASLRIAPDARAALMSLLGGDRQASRNELKKLTLFAHGEGEVTLDHVMAVVSDASELKLDPIVDGAFAGQAGAGRKRICQSHGRRHLSRHHHRRGAAPRGLAAQIGAGGRGRHAGSSVLDSGFPRLHFSRKPMAETALRNFSPSRLAAIIDQLATAALRHAQADRAGRRHRAAHAAVDRGQCEGMSAGQGVKRFPS